MNIYVANIAVAAVASFINQYVLSHSFGQPSVRPSVRSHPSPSISIASISSNYIILTTVNNLNSIIRRCGWPMFIAEPAHASEHK